jgi:hypothetical protein
MNTNLVLSLLRTSNPFWKWSCIAPVCPQDHKVKLFFTIKLRKTNAPSVSNYMSHICLDSHGSVHYTCISTNLPQVIQDGGGIFYLFRFWYLWMWLLHACMREMHWRTHNSSPLYKDLWGKTPTTLKTNTLYIYTWRKEESPSRDADG